jgi:hypothetical protein
LEKLNVPQDRPSAAPTLIEAKMVNSSAAIVAWNLPLPDEHNGQLLGYQVAPVSKIFLFAHLWK